MRWNNGEEAKERGTITFYKEDSEGVESLHNDVVIVSLAIVNYDVCCILVDNGSSVDLLFYNTFLGWELP